MRREAAVAGQFYRGTPEGLRAQVAQYTEPVADKVPVKGLISPHAGLDFSGAVAGAIYSRITFPKSFIILGPNHSGSGSPASIMVEGTWRTPMGEVEIDGELAASIKERCHSLSEDPEAHLREHSLEVQLPFMQYFSQEFRIVPIALWRADWGFCRELGQALAEAARERGEGVVLVGSTDMTHIHGSTVEAVRLMDEPAIDRILQLDPEGLLRTVKVLRLTMCGAGPTAAVLTACKALGPTEAELIKYMTSADVTGDTSYIVGYAGFLLK